ncbi:HlyD family secretion protein [Advenella mimigardefordensis]|uniref:Putative multidrug resistance protein EmrA, RND family n=1 Tax=Advenella mimigardefordensis (strain DSM 17166 / LMG 22922 / DPN7) TaxID=1247726 RepID=W0PIS1_ADVMD|nr:efflux RND transporter periplasmic adaptor subunit [Advenella mimigardefordensis]AHG65857.1 putative multidrug resistance protein EmrA, RND family [Advenella mimigardefordensis DPN7]
MSSNSNPTTATPDAPSAVPASADAGAKAKQKKKPAGNKRSFLFKLLFLVVVVIAVIAGVMYYLNGRWYESTDDAYVQGNIIQITPQVGGTVVGIFADDGDFVHAGDTLIRLDQTEAEVALNEAKAALAKTVREVRSLYSQASGAKATSGAQLAMVQAQESAVKGAKTALDKAQADYGRRQKLVKSGAISAEESAHARDVFLQAQSQYQSALSQLEATRSQLTASEQTAEVSNALVAGTLINQHPDILVAEAKLKAAYLTFVRSTITAPADGYVAKRAAQVGQRVAAGSAMMAVVPLKNAWIYANFKETQMKDMRIGQPVSITSDLYGDDVVYDGVISSLGIGTGSAFALLPAQNATGNWIKIVQRIPVRVEFAKPEQLEKHPLRIGMSMFVEADLHNTDGAVLATGVNPNSKLQTTIYDQQVAAADRLIADIVQQNLATSDADTKKADE